MKVGAKADVHELTTSRTLRDLLASLLSVLFCTVFVASSLSTDRLVLPFSLVSVLFQLGIAVLLQAQRGIDQLFRRTLLAGFAFEVLTVLAYQTRQVSSVGPAQVVFVWVFGAVGLACYVVAAEKLLRPIIQFPETARGARLIVVGFTASLATAQWLHAGSNLGARSNTVIRTILGISCIVLIAGRVVLDAPLRRRHRLAELQFLTATCVFGVGQAAAFGWYGSSPPARAFVFVTFASGLLAAATLRASIGAVGEPIGTVLTKPRPTRPIMLVAVYVANGIMARLFRVPGGTPVVVFIIAVIAVVQLVGVLWLGEQFLTLRRMPLSWHDRRLRREIRSALALDHLEAHFAPILLADDLSYAGFEAVPFWNHPGLAAVPSERIRTLARSQGLVDVIDQLMIVRTAVELPHLSACISGDQPFATVRVDGGALQEPGFGDLVLADLSRRGCSARGLVFDIEESTVVFSWPELHRNVAVLREAGIRLAIDDFGSGQANLGLLVGLDPWLVKVDERLILAAVSSPRGREVTSFAIGAARSSGAQMVGRGVMDRAWVPELHEMNFHLLQGTALGSALPASSYLGGTTRLKA